ncbi:LysR substrate-binding domain-containing protein [Sporomusa sp.]|uniref:LysR substrate-binding domain-containing protein n=1 Tax=Sporomusa sp. TaxID=2078658 RepID=UPI002BCE4B53|nr:LysR substrate-binding domain-containing protein [Sporomusa sp.]HWR42018.1 LysR substrate-binding domain-containing protein [Sporomusa sp.]
MEFRNLIYFVMLAEELHFGKAAKRLNMSQPPLSQQIQKFEEELGAKLFERTHKEVKLTFVGRTLLPEAKKILKQTENAISIVKKASRGEYGEIRVSYGETASFRLLSEVMKRFHDKYPFVEIILSEMSTDQQVASLKEGTIDIGLIHPPKRLSGLEHQYVLTDPLIVILPESHQLAIYKEIPLSALKNEIFVIPRRESGPLAEYIMEVCQNEGFVPKITRHDVMRLTVSTLVAGGAGIALLPESSTQVITHGTVCLKLSPGTLGIELHAAFRKDENNAVVTNFLDTISQLMRGE